MRHVSGFVRQLSHDLRNQLNAAELQSTLLNELANDSEIKSEVQRLRGILASMGASLHRLTTSLSPARLTEMTYEADAFVQDLRQKLTIKFPEESSAIDWENNLGNAMLQIDPQILQEAFLELFANAFQHERTEDRLRASANLQADKFVFILREPKKSFAHATDNWGGEPLQKMSHGHYGLGLHRARNIIENHHGRLQAHYDELSSSLVTTITLPLAAAK